MNIGPCFNGIVQIKFHSCCCIISEIHIQWQWKTGWMRAYVYTEPAKNNANSDRSKSHVHETMLQCVLIVCWTGISTSSNEYSLKNKSGKLDENGENPDNEIWIDLKSFTVGFDA